MAETSFRERTLPGVGLPPSPLRVPIVTPVAIGPIARIPKALFDVSEFRLDFDRGKPLPRQGP